MNVRWCDVAVILTVTSVDLQFKAVTCRLSSCINGADVYLWVYTDVKSNFRTCIHVHCCALSGNGDIVWYYTYPYLLRCFGLTSVNDLCSVPLTTIYWMLTEQHTSASSPGWLRGCVPDEIQVQCALCDSVWKSYSRSSSCTPVPAWACREPSEVDYVSGEM